MLVPNQTPITGKEEQGDLSSPLQTLVQFYHAFNSGDLKEMSDNWEQSEDIAMDNPLGVFILLKLSYFFIRRIFFIFVMNFSKRWKNAEVTIHEEIAEGNRVVLLWSFKADQVSNNQPSSWGGITILRFNKAGKIVAEIGEESEPGPQARLSATDISD